jgi:hypothetical protein
MNLFKKIDPQYHSIVERLIILIIIGIIYYFC